MPYQFYTIKKKISVKSKIKWKQERIQFKAKDSEMKPYPVCLGNILKYFTIENMKK